MYKQYTRKLGKIGRTKTPSYYMTLPMELVKELKWRDGQELVVRRAQTGNHLIIETVWHDDPRSRTNFRADS